MATIFVKIGFFDDDSRHRSQNFRNGEGHLFRNNGCASRCQASGEGAMTGQSADVRRTTRRCVAAELAAH